MLQDLPKQFKEFIKLCDGIDFSFDNCSINFKKREQQEEHYSETIEEISLSENTADKNIFCSYVKNTDFSELNEEIYETEKILKKDKTSFIKEYVNFVINKDTITLNEYLFKLNCSEPNNEVVLAIKKDAEKLYDETLEEYNELMQIKKSYELYLKQTNNNFEGVITLPDIDIIYNYQGLKGGIHLPDGGIILFNAILNSDMSITNIELNYYEYLVDITAIRDDNTLDYNTVDKSLLANESVFPAKSDVLFFNKLLVENNMEDFSKKPIAAIYKLKDELIKTVLTNTDFKNNQIK